MGWQEGIHRGEAARWIRGIAAASLLIAGTIGAPVGLVHWGRYPAAISLLQPDDGTLLLSALTWVGWIAWAAFTTATLLELSALITGHPRRMPGLSGLQQVAGGLLVLVIAVLPLSNLAQPPAQQTPTAQTPTPSAQPTAQVSPQTTQATPAELSNTATYTVVAGDDLWSVAERLLGDGRDWRVLAELNPQLVDSAYELRPGTKLKIPTVTHQPAAPAAPAKKTTTVKVHKGDTLSGLAKEHLKSASKWPRIAKANPVITDPDHIEIGWRLEIPGQTAHSAKATSGATNQDKTSHSTTPTSSTPPAFSPAPSPSTEPQQSPASSQSAARSSADLGSPGTQTAEPHSAELQPTEPHSASPDTASDQPANEAPSTAPITVGTLAAAALVGALEGRRLLRQRERPLGRRHPPAAPATDQLRTSLKVAQGGDGLVALVAALRQIGNHCHRQGIALPQLASVRVGKQEIALEWAGPTVAPPFGFTGDHRHWSAPITPALPTCEHPCAYPALVSLGTAENGEVLLVDAEQSQILGIAGRPDQCQDALTAMAVELACAPWSQDVRLTCVGTSADLAVLAGSDRVHLTNQEAALTLLRQVVAQREQSLVGASLTQLRCDRDQAEAVVPYVFVFIDCLPAELIAELEQLLAGERLGVAVILRTDAAAPAQWEIGGDPSRLEGRLHGQPGTWAAHAIGADVRADLRSLLTETESVPAPWWGDDNVYQLPIRVEEEVDIVRLVEPAAHPRLLLIGPTQLHGANGPEPSRSRQQLMELCAWMLEHPGGTATQMAAGMAIAESTRRSNLSRLRNWLGQDAAGEPYLPDAYSGRISLHWGVSSDWHQLQVLLTPGADRVADSTLIAALELVRGAPLADAAPGQWYWAEELRTNISAALRDVGVVLGERALRSNDLEVARWAAARALVVAPEDELLLRVRLRTEYLAGNRADTERLVNQLTRQARILGVDLMPETVELCQQVIEGRTRARA